MFSPWRSMGCTNGNAFVSSGTGHPFSLGARVKERACVYCLFYGSGACFFHPGSISLRRICALAFHGEVLPFLVFRACPSYHLLGHFFFLGATSQTCR